LPQNSQPTIHTTLTKPLEYTERERASLAAKLKELRSSGTQAKDLNNYDLLRLLELVEESEKREDLSGFHKWFKPGPYGIENLPKHRAFFEATGLYRETMLLGGNRVGKTRSGATVCSVVATGQYPEWWEGAKFNCSTSIWAAGKTGQTTRDTVQDALLGPPGHWGTGALPADCIVRTTARQGIPNAVDTIEVKNVFGGISTIGLKSYDQKPAAFYGTAKHIVWLDEPCPDLVYNECLIRTMTTDGRVIHTITPKDGLTRLIAEFLSSCDLLAGAERIKGLEAMIKLAEADDLNNGL
jgi:phage terminase large subunit-like protein